MSKRKRNIQLTIPEGAEPGVDSLTCLVDGTEIEIPIPLGSKVGDTLQIQLGETEDDSGDGDDGGNDDSDPNITAVQLHDSIGVTLDLHHSVRVPNTDGDGDDDEGKKDGADGTHAVPWPAGIHLAKQLASSQLKDIIVGARKIVELGSGSGLVGLAVAAMISSQKDKQKRKKLKTNNDKEEESSDSDDKVTITMTDFPTAIPLLEHNTKMNKDRISSSVNDPICYRTESLIWGASTQCKTKDEDTDIKENASSSQGTDLIIGSDLLYNAKPETYNDLCSTIKDLNATKKARIILSVRWRKPNEEREFFQLMEASGYKFNLLAANNGGDGDDQDVICNLGWKDFGNPKCSRSNEYFTNTYVQVDGETKALKDVSEDDMDVMSDKEYNTFEMKFIQIYVSDAINE